MKHSILFLAVCLCAAASAKLPTPVLDDAAKAKAAETAAKTAWQGKIDAYLLCKAQDRVAAAYRKKGGATMVNAKDVKTTAAMPAAMPAPAGAAAPAAAPPAASAAKPASAVVAAATPAAVPPAAAASGTPVAAVASPAPALTPCADPGPFAYSPPEQKPLETSGAHSPASNAASPPSVRPESATMAPAKAATAQSKKP